MVGDQDGVVMNHFELRNPFPPLKGFRTRLPHLGAYHYDAANSWMFNSGLIGVDARAHPVAGRHAGLHRRPDRAGAQKFPTIEQFALSAKWRG